MRSTEKPTDTTKRYVIAKYVEPARTNGEATIQVKVPKLVRMRGLRPNGPLITKSRSPRRPNKLKALPLPPFLKLTRSA